MPRKLWQRILLRCHPAAERLRRLFSCSYRWMHLRPAADFIRRLPSGFRLYVPVLIAGGMLFWTLSLCLPSIGYDIGGPKKSCLILNVDNVQSDLSAAIFDLFREPLTQNLCVLADSSSLHLQQLAGSYAPLQVSRDHHHARFHYSLKAYLSEPDSLLLIGAGSRITSSDSALTILGGPRELTAERYIELLKKVSSSVTGGEPSVAPPYQLSDQGLANYYYLVGLNKFLSGGRENLTDAARHYSMALGVDDTFNAAEARLAEAIAQMYICGWDSEQHTLMDCLSYAQHAVSCCRTSPLNHKVLGVCHLAVALRGPCRGDDRCGDEEIEQAIEETQKAIDLNGAYYQAHVNMIALHRLRGNTKKAHMSFQQAIRICPDCEQAYVNEGNTLCDEERYEEAITMYEYAIRLNPGKGMPYYNLACVFARQCRLETAMHYLRLALRYQDRDYRHMMYKDPDLEIMRAYFSDDEVMQYVSQSRLKENI